MNPKSPTNLDPKLREAYERIMSGTPPTQQEPQTPPPQQEPQQPQAFTPPAQPIQAQENQPQSEQPQFPSNLQQAPQEQQSFNPPPPRMETQQIEEPAEQFQSPVSQTEQDITSSPLYRSGLYTPAQQNSPQQTEEQQIPIGATDQIVNGDSPVAPPEKSHKLRSFILGVGVILFLIAYTVVWAKIFGLF